MMFLSNRNQGFYYLSKNQLFKNLFINRRANPVYLKCCEFFGTILIDRTHTIEPGINFQIIDKIPATQGFNLSFQDVCEARASQIIRQVKGEIKLLWSGGIDSTVALISILSALVQLDQLHRLTILLSKESISEYPSFFKDVIKDKLNYQLIETTIFDTIDSHDIIVTGEHGDQLFGSDKLKYPVISGDAYSPFDQIIDFIIPRKLGTDKYTVQIIDFLDPLIGKSPVKIKTLYDYLWWLNFSLKWQTVSMRLIHGLNRSYLDLERTVFHFFRTEDFQNWSIFNHDKKIKKDWNTYKYVAKEYIYNYHRDEHYLQNKEKEQSLKEVIVNPKEAGLFKKRLKRMKMHKETSRE